MASRIYPFLLLPQCWKFSVLAIGALQGVRAGVQGFRYGMQAGLLAGALFAGGTTVGAVLVGGIGWWRAGPPLRLQAGDSWMDGCVASNRRLLLQVA